MKNIPHESAVLHVTGKAVYIEDISIENPLSGLVFYSSVAKGRILSVDKADAEKVPGVKAILLAKDIPGENQMGPVFHDEPVLADGNVNCIGQAIAIIAAETEDAAYKARDLIKVTYKEDVPILTIEQAMAKGELLQPQRKIEIGNVQNALNKSEYKIEGELHVGGQEHWYLETQSALCVPGEGSEMKVFSSTQNPAETQALVAEVLGVSKNEIEVETRRLGGGFGGKETQGNHVAIWAALLANATKRPVKIKLFRDEDQKITGKRHPFLIRYKVGFDKKGIINAIDVEQNCNGGWASDLTMSILERAQMHAENAYYIPNMRIIGNAWKTNLPSNTAYRGFGGPQGIAAMETIIDRIAMFLKMDSALVRYRNFYGMDDRNITPYGQKVENNRLYMIWDELMKSSEYEKQKKEVDDFNSKNEFKKRGIALTPVKFGISFTTSFLNQAGALVNIYKDGSVLVNHGGTEMGQGLYTKMRQIAALELGISLDKVKVNATNTSKVPNTSPTAASSGTDMNGMAVKNAVDTLKERIAGVMAEHFTTNGIKTSPKEILFENNSVFVKGDKNRSVSFAEAVQIVYFSRTSLSATGFYKTPGVYFDREKGSGNPFYYFSFGMNVSTVEVDVLTGRHKILRSDIIHDVGKSINDNIDIGQIEGAFIQGVGWVTSEEMKYDGKGNLLNHSPDTYKIPGINDIPEIFNVSLLKNAPNPNTIRRSKAVGEPPFMLAFSVWLAVKYAVSSVGGHKKEPVFNIPATNENILLAIESVKK